MNRLWMLTLCWVVVGQAPRPAFEAASIKPNSSGGNAVRIGNAAGGRFSATNITVRELILQAYGLQSFQVTGGPGWISEARFDIEAVPPPGAAPSREQTQAMQQSLLEERFQLKVSRDTKPMPSFTLNLAKGGSKLKASSDQTPVTPGVPRSDAAPRGQMRMMPGNLTGVALPLSALLRLISGQVGRPVVDKTGLTGRYDFDLHWTPDRPVNLPPGFDAPPIDPNGPTIFTALQEQLGLQLESITEPSEVLVIERIEKPSDN